MVFRFISLKLLFLFLVIHVSSWGQDSLDYFDQDYIRHRNYIYDTLIKTPRMYQSGWELAMPLITLHSDEILQIEFDDLSSNIRDFHYEIRHCNADWEFSELPYYEYMDGFEINPITQYQYSFNTLVKYIHYSFQLPNQDVTFRKSGNYLLLVYDSYEKNKLVFTRRFRLVENLVSIKAEARQTRISEYLLTSHEVDFTIDLGNIQVNDPYSEIQVTISQNGRQDNQLTSLKPLFIKDKLLIYDYDRENIFNGVNEFRYFDIKSIRYQSDRIARVKYIGQTNHIFLYADEKRNFKRYFYDEDINGKFIVEIQEADNPDIEADYVWVHFNLVMDQPLVHGNLYVAGQLFDWNYTKTNQMEYDFETKRYTLKALLKQGYYNYCYAFLEDDSHVADYTYVEGNHYETENDYIIYVYKRDLYDNYDRLVGYLVVNSVIK